jgi:putative lipoprotein (rSAM/lipoprotein system)
MIYNTKRFLMKQITSKGRLLLRRIFAVLSFGATATLLSCPAYGMAPAMYGPSPVDHEVIEGTVKSADAEEPIPGISVSVANDRYTLTDENGKYQLQVIGATTTVIFEDIDGPENGDFQGTEVTWKSGDGTLNVVLERRNTENDQ